MTLDDHVNELQSIAKSQKKKKKKEGKKIVSIMSQNGNQNHQQALILGCELGA